MRFYTCTESMTSTVKVPISVVKLVRPVTARSTLRFGQIRYSVMDLVNS